MRLLMTAGLLALPVSSWAINTEPAGFYAGAGVSQIDFSGKTSEGLKEKPEWSAAELSAGYKHSPFVGVETRLGFGSSPGLMYGGVYYRTESANDTAKTYLLAGFSAATIDSDNGGKDTSLSGFSYGAGVGFPVGSNLNFNLEYRVLLDDGDEDVKLNAFTASVDYRFGDSGLGSFAAPSPDKGFYAGLGVAQIEFDEDSSSEEEVDSSDDEDMEEDDGAPKIKWNAIELIGGYHHNPLAVAEVRIGTTDKEGEEGVDLSLTYASIYYRPTVVIGKAQLYGLLGYSSVRYAFREDLGDGEIDKGSDTSSGISYGAGLQFAATERISAGLEYRILARDKVEQDTETLTALSARVTYRF